MLTYFPKYFTNRAMAFYFAAVAVVGLVYFRYAMEWYFYIIGAVSVCGFFYFANLLPRQWAKSSPRRFEKRLFWTAFAIRAIYVTFSYFLYLGMTGMPFEWGAADVMFYDEMGRYGHSLISRGKFDLLPKFERYSGAAFSDSGYPIWLSIVYTLTDNSIYITRIIKALLSAWTCVLIYRLAARNFGESTGRMAAIFCMLMPNLIYYCGMHLKETEMVFLEVLFAERADALLRERNFKFWNILGLVAIVFAVFMFRTALGIVMVLAMGAAMVFTSSKVVGWGRRIAIILLGVILLGTMLGDSIMSEVQEMTSTDVNAYQQGNMNWRAEREGGNKFAKYASKAVFAPMIFTIPFPTIINTQGQENQRMIHGGNYVKNITSVFTIFALFVLLFSGEWRKYVFPLALMLGYLAVIALSAFAHSERFHLPALPFALMFAAYGISQVQNKHKKWFMYWCVLMFVAIVGWSLFKLAGRGMV